MDGWLGEKAPTEEDFLAQEEPLVNRTLAVAFYKQGLKVSPSIHA